MIKKKELISKLRSDCGFGLISYSKRHGKLLSPDKNGGWITEKKRGWHVGINGDTCSYVFPSKKKAREFVSKHWVTSVVVIKEV